MPIEPIPPAPLWFPNRFAHYFLHALEAEMGKKGIAGALQAANLAHWFENYPLEDTKRDVNYAEFSMLNGGLELFIGRRLGRGFARRAGRRMMQEHLTDFGGGLTHIDNPALKLLPMNARLKIALSPIIIQITGDNPATAITTLYHTDTHIHISIEHCPVCLGRTADNSPGTGANEPICAAIVGLLEGALARVTNGQKFQVTETRCIAQGADSCDFEITNKPLSPHP
jgi:hypothetical protein